MLFFSSQDSQTKAAASTQESANLSVTWAFPSGWLILRNVFPYGPWLWWVIAFDSLLSPCPNCTFQFVAVFHWVVLSSEYFRLEAAEPGSLNRFTWIGCYRCPITMSGQVWSCPSSHHKSIWTILATIRDLLSTIQIVGFSAWIIPSNRATFIWSRAASQHRICICVPSIQDSPLSSQGLSWAHRSQIRADQ